MSLSNRDQWVPLFSFICNDRFNFVLALSTLSFHQPCLNIICSTILCEHWILNFYLKKFQIKFRWMIMPYIIQFFSFFLYRLIATMSSLAPSVVMVPLSIKFCSCRQKWGFSVKIPALCFLEQLSFSFNQQTMPKRDSETII